MPAIKPSFPTDAYSTLQNKQFEVGEKNDCVVKMLALALKVPYEAAHYKAFLAGRKSGKGLYSATWMAILNRAGLRLVLVPAEEIIAKYPKAHQGLKSITTHHPDRFHKVWDDGHRYIFHLARHVAYVEGGRIHDWTRGSAKRVIEVYRLEEK